MPMSSQRENRFSTHLMAVDTHLSAEMIWSAPFGHRQRSSSREDLGLGLAVQTYTERHAPTPILVSMSQWSDRPKNM